ncbi:MAG: hypothetical protein KAV87_02770, partial [Desulfobacteraceae bacterium]|nr:hypothetical protein [Desulfobacteraceae bacterium]
MRNFKDEIWGCVCQDYLHIVKKLKQEMRLKVFASAKPGLPFFQKRKTWFFRSDRAFPHADRSEMIGCAFKRSGRKQ